VFLLHNVTYFESGIGKHVVGMNHPLVGALFPSRVTKLVNSMVMVTKVVESQVRSSSEVPQLGTDSCYFSQGMGEISLSFVHGAIISTLSYLGCPRSRIGAKKSMCGDRLTKKRRNKCIKLKSTQVNLIMREVDSMHEVVYLASKYLVGRFMRRRMGETMLKSWLDDL